MGVNDTHNEMENGLHICVLVFKGNMASLHQLGGVGEGGGTCPWQGHEVRTTALPTCSATKQPLYQLLNHTIHQ
jgi:hypothetical protein